MGIFFIGRGLTWPSHLWMRRQLDGLGSDVTVLATTSEDVGPYRGRYHLVTLREHPAPLLWRAARAFTLTKIARAMKTREVSKVLIQFATDAVLFNTALRSSSKSVFVHCHGYDVTWDLKEHLAANSRKPRHDPHYADKVRDLPNNFSFIANSKRTQQRLLDIGIPLHRIHLKYMGVDAPDTLQRRAPRTSALTVLFLGRLIDFKGPDLVIRAFELACQLGFDGRLIMAGDGPLALTCELLRAHSPYRDRIELLGAVDTPTGEQLRNEADIFTAHNCTGPISGQEEAFGVSMVEAMASGLPIVNTSNGSIPEVVQNGRQGFLVKSGDIQAHADALIKLGSNPALRTELGENGWRRALQNFSIELEIKRLREIMDINNQVDA